MARKGSRSEWQKPSMLSHQKCNGMFAHYRIKRSWYALAAERRGDIRLYHWVMAFKPFLQWGKPDGDAPWPK